MLIADREYLILRSGVGVYHRAALRADPLAASRRMRDIRVSWFETAEARLLTMRREPTHLSRRRFLKSTAAGLLSAAVPEIARAQLGSRSRSAPGRFPLSIPETARASGSVRWNIAAD